MLKYVKEKEILLYRMMYNNIKEDVENKLSVKEEPHDLW
jgi:hypothetical protein